MIRTRAPARTKKAQERRTKNTKDQEQGEQETCKNDNKQEQEKHKKTLATTIKNHSTRNI